MLVLFISTTLSQAAIVDGSCGDNLTWSLNTKDSTLTITGSGEMTSRPWSDYNSYIKYVFLPDGLTSIEDDAFYDCSGLTSVTIPNSVTSIGYAAFDGYSGLTSLTCEATNPPILESNVFFYVDKSTCILYVPAESIDLYKAADQWKDFTNIIGIAPQIETKEKNVDIVYLDKENDELHSESVTFNVPVAPEIEGFTFLKWTAASDNIEDGIILQTIYTADAPTSAPEVVTNPSNPAQKLIRNGSVYILTDDSRTYTLTGQQVR